MKDSFCAPVYFSYRINAWTWDMRPKSGDIRPFNTRLLATGIARSPADVQWYKDLNVRRATLNGEL